MLEKAQMVSGATPVMQIIELLMSYLYLPLEVESNPHT